MKRLLLMMAAVASVTAATPLAAPAFARDGDQRGGRAERQERGPRAERGRGPERGERRGGEDRGRPRYDDDDRRGRAPVLGYGDNGRRRDDDRGRYAPRPVYEPRQREEERPRYGGAPRPQGFSGPPPSSARRGGYLPRNFSGEIVDDFRRYRLRTPPAGFAWVRMGNGFALVSMRDGQIFDMVQ